MPNRSIAKAMLVDRALVLKIKEIKLKYNIFTNIMTNMLSNVKIYSLEINNSTTSLRIVWYYVFRSSKTFLITLWEIQNERWLKTAVYIYIYICI